MWSPTLTARPFLEHGLGDAQMRLGLGVGIFFHRLVEAARDHIVGHRHATFPRLLADVFQHLVDVRHHDVRLIAAQQEIQHPSTGSLGQRAPVAPHHV